MRKVVITGATGAIGRALIKICTEAGYEVLAIVHRESKRAEEPYAARTVKLDPEEYEDAITGLEKQECIRILKLDLQEYEEALPEFEKQGIPTSGYDLFFHLAWMGTYGGSRENEDLQEKNIEYSLAAAKLAKSLGCSTFVGAGSQAEYGRVEGMLSADTPTAPETSYGKAKLIAGEETRTLCTDLKICHIWCRILSVYGPYDRPETLISTAVTKMLAGEDTEFTPCDQLWDYIYSEDAARAMLIAAQKGRDSSIYVIGSGVARPLKEYIETIAKLTSYQKQPGFSKRPYNDKQVMHLQADPSSLFSLGFKCKVPFEEGIRRIIATCS